MTLQEMLDKLDPMQRERFLGRLEGMQMAQRIARNRVDDNVEYLALHDPDMDLAEAKRRGDLEAENVATMIRFVQVAIGNGTLEFGPLTASEQDAINRIY